MDFNSSTQRHLKKIKNKFESRNINGKDILEITPYHQLNLFILKNLYDKWVYNFNSNKIKYFNYDSEDVIQTTKKLMNILSNNISIDIVILVVFSKNLQMTISWQEIQKNILKKIYLLKSGMTKKN